MSSHVDGGEDLGRGGRHHDPSTWRDKEMQGYRDQGCLDAGIQGCRGAGIRNVRIRSAGMRGYRDQGCKQLTHCLGRRKERNYGKHLASARGAPAPPGTVLWVQSVDGHCVEHRENGVTPPKKIHKFGDLNSFTFTNQEH